MDSVTNSAGQEFAQALLKPTSLPGETSDFLAVLAPDGAPAPLPIPAVPLHTPAPSAGPLMLPAMPLTMNSGWAKPDALPKPFQGGFSGQDTVGKESSDSIQHGGLLNSISDLPSEFSAYGHNFNTMYTQYAYMRDKDGSIDPEWIDNNREEIDNSLIVGMPMDQQYKILRAPNLQSARSLRVTYDMARSELAKVSGWGGDSMFIGMVNQAADPAQSLAMIASSGLSIAARAANLTRLGTVAAEGTIGAASFGGAQAFAGSRNATGNDEDVLDAALIGFVLQGAGGFFGKVESPNLAAENGALKKNALAIYEGRDVAGEVLPPVRGIEYRPPKVEGQIIDAEFSDVGAAPKDPLGLPAPVEPKPVPRPEINDIAPVYENGKLELPATVNSVEEAAGYVAKHSRNPEMRSLVEELRASLAESNAVGFKILTKEDPNFLPADAGITKSQQGFKGVSINDAASGESTIYLTGKDLNPNNHGMNEETFVHELIHSAAASKYRAGIVGKGSPELNQAATDLQNLHAKALEASQGKDLPNSVQEALTHPDELLAYGLTDKSVQDFLKSIPAEGEKNLWQTFKDKLKDLLGISRDKSSMFDKLVEAKEGLLKSKKATVPDDEITARYQVADEDPSVSKEGFPSIFGWGLSREYRLLNKKVPERIRALAAKIGGNKVGWKGNSTVEHSVSEHANTLEQRWNVRLSKELWYKSGYRDWFAEQKAAGKYKAVDEEFGARVDFQEQVQDYIRGFENPDGWHPSVIKAGDGVRNLIGGDVLENINNPSAIFGGSKRGMTQEIIKDAETGVESLSQALPANPNYLPRKLSYQKISDMVKSIGVEGVQKFFAGARKSVDPVNITDEQAAKFGKWYYETFNEAHATGNDNLLSDLVGGTDKNALKMSLMRNGKFTEREAMDIIEEMFPSKPNPKARANSNLKHRSEINETHTMKVDTADGGSVDVSINDFLDNNLEKNLHGYFKRMAGDISFAHKMDVYKNSDWENVLNDTVRRDLSDADLIPEEMLTKWRKDLNWYRDMVKGIPQEASSWWSRSLDMAMKYNVMRLMGYAGLNQSIEWGNLTGALGFRSLTETAGELKSFYRNAATGEAPHKVLEDIEHLMGGPGSDFVKMSSIGNEDNWVSKGGNTKWNRALDWTSTKLNRGTHRMYKYNGMLGTMVQQQRMMALGGVNHWFGLATGKLKQSAWLTKKRLAWMGIDEGMFDRITENMRKYTTAKEGVGGPGHTVDSIDFAKWQKEDSESMWSFLWGMERESRRVVQENDMASAIPIFDGALGKAFFQFQGFGFHAWDKALMHGINQRDLTTFNSVMHGGFVASLQYIARSYIATAGMSDEKRKKFLERRLNTQQIIANSYGRVGMASILPQLVDTISPVPVFSGMRSTTDISSVFSSPVFQLLNTGIATKKYVRNAFSSEYQTTDKDVRATFNLLMLNNLPPVSVLGNALAGQFPSNENVNQ